MDKPDETKLTKPEREELFAYLVAKLREVETFHVPDVFGGWARRGAATRCCDARLVSKNSSISGKSS